MSNSIPEPAWVTDEFDETLDMDPAYWVNKQHFFHEVPLTGDVLLSAFQRGLFPWNIEIEPKAWWSPDPRAVLWLNQFHISRSLRKVIRQGHFKVTFDTAFQRVLEGCANRLETWLYPELMTALHELHNRKIAHSAECWLGDDLVGGVYGMDVDGIFLGDSMFSSVSNASKVALAALVDQLKSCGFKMMDCQVLSSHTHSLGARNIPRRLYLTYLHRMQSGSLPMATWQDKS